MFHFILQLRNSKSSPQQPPKSFNYHDTLTGNCLLTLVVGERSTLVFQMDYGVTLLLFRLYVRGQLLE